MPKKRNVFLPTNHYRGYELPPFPKKFWDTLSKDIPTDHRTPEINEYLRKEVAECCAWLIREQRRLNASVGFSEAMRRHKRDATALYEKFADSLKDTARLWKKASVRNIYHDKRLSKISQFDNLPAMAKAAQKTLDGLKTLEPRFTGSLIPGFAVRMKKVFRQVGINPECTGHIYDKSSPLKSGKTTKEGTPSWFQKFMLALMTDFIDKEAKRLKLAELHAPKVHNHKAFYMMVAKSGRLLKIRKAG